MEQSGRLTIVLATLLVSSLESVVLLGASSSLPPATSAQAPSPRRRSGGEARSPRRLDVDRPAPSDRLRRLLSIAGRISLADGNGAPDHPVSAESGSSRGPAGALACADGGARGPPYRRRARFGQPSPSTTPMPADGLGPGAAARPACPRSSRPRRWSRPTSAFRSTSPPPCGSPTPGR